MAKVTKPIKRKRPGLSYMTYPSGSETSEFTYQPVKWKKPYRFIVIRRPVPKEPSEQLSLFRRKVQLTSYRDEFKNQSAKPWKFYNARAAVELIIKELKADYLLAKIPTKHYASSETYFHLLLFAYNLVNWFKRLCMSKSFHQISIKSLRAQMLFVPGELVRTDNKPMLKFPSNFWYKDIIAYAMKQTEEIKL